MTLLPPKTISTIYKVLDAAFKVALVLNIENVVVAAGVLELYNQLVSCFKNGQYVYRQNQQENSMEKVLIENIEVGDKLLSCDVGTGGQLFMDDVILVNKHENVLGICKTLRIYFDKDEEV